MDRYAKEREFAAAAEQQPGDQPAKADDEDVEGVAEEIAAWLTVA